MDEKIQSACMIYVQEQQLERKLWQENHKNTMKGFRLAMQRLGENLEATTECRQAGFDEVCDRQTRELEKLQRLIEQETSNRTQGEQSMMTLLEGVHAKLHNEVMRERTERQNTETVLMKLLEESVEAIAIKADEDTLRQLHDMRKERERDRLMRQKQLEQEAAEPARRIAE